jgi:hypothetical protein
MKFSGLLHDATGKPLSGAVDVTFALYNAEAGGGPMWFETQTVQADELGRYTALLGAMHPDGLPVDLFASGEVRWLGIQVGLEAEQPRVLLVSVPYALKAGDAETLGGKPASAYMLSEAQSGTATRAATNSTAVAAQAGTSGTTKKSRTANTAPLTACASVTSGGAATVNSVARFTTACNIESSAIAQSGSNVGIGTATPIYKLDVVGGSARVTNPSGTTQLQITGSASSGRLGQDAGGFFFASDTNGGAVRLLTNNGALHEWLRVTSAGKVGIGTTAPAASLEVNGTARFDGLAAFAGGQTVTGNVTISGALTSNGLIIVPSATDLTSGLPYVSANIVAGYTGATGGNKITAGVAGGTIGGGGGTFNGFNFGNVVTDDGGTVAGGFGNQAGDGIGSVSSRTSATVGGGWGNIASGSYSTVAGGNTLTAQGDDSAVGGGYGNTATGEAATIAGGWQNQAPGSSSTVPGGTNNVANGGWSFAAGSYADAHYDGDFVWGDHSSASAITAAAANQFVVRASGGVWFGTNNTISFPASSFIGTSTGAYLTTGGTWTNSSDQNLKTGFKEIDELNLLAHLDATPIRTWSYKAEPLETRHIGPTAQDFYAAFGLGEDDKHITTVDEGGVALAGVQALYRLSLVKDAQIRKLTAEVERLKKVEKEMTLLEARLARLERQDSNTSSARADNRGQ